jgi:hypothetical protein
MRTVRPTVVALLATWIGLLAGSAAAETDRNFTERIRDITADLLVARPLGLAQLVAGAAFLPVGYGIVLVTREDIDVLDICIEAPARQVFQRPLGEL